MLVYFQFNCTGGWVDYSDSVDMTKFTRELSLDENNDPRKVITGAVNLTGASYVAVYNFLVINPNIYSNSVCVKIIDNTCNNDEYYFKLDNKNLKWCDTDGCSMEFDMVGYEPALDCVKTTPIADNTYGWFDTYGPFNHPRYRYCDSFKPTGLFAFILGIAAILNLLIAFVNAFIYILQPVFPSLQPFNSLTNILGGCELAWPAPYIRTYVDNVCNICGLTADITTMPVFYDLWNPLQPVVQNPYYYATLLTAYTKKGVSANGNKTYIYNNAPSWTLRTFLSKIKLLWNARYFIHNNKVYFHRKDKIGELIWGASPVIDFSTGTDADFLTEGVCFEWNGDGKVKRLYFQYKNDMSDSIGNELRNRFNGEYIDTSGNPNYTDMIDEDAEFGCASFVGDLNDSNYDSVLTLFVASAGGSSGPLKTQGDTLELPKILIHDAVSPLLDARVIKTSYVPYINLASMQDDDNVYGNFNPNTGAFYNWPMSFSPDMNVINRNLWQWHEIDKPSPDKRTNIGFQFKITYCCGFNTLNLYQKVKFKDGYYGEINEILFDHENRSINVKGNLI